MPAPQAAKIQVAIRLRPALASEGGSATARSVHVDEANNTVSMPSRPSDPSCKDTRSFQFDNVFGPETTQEHVFENVVKGLIPSVLSGFNATVFAYGQTGSGKTFTMEGAFGGVSAFGASLSDRAAISFA